MTMLLCGPAPAVVIAPAPGQQVDLLDERVLLTFDPLTGSQTVVVQHTFRGTAAPFGLIIPVPRQASIRSHSERLVRAIDRRLHPMGRIQRTLDVALTSWVGGCAVRDVGDALYTGDGKKRPEGASGAVSTLGSAPEPLHDWVLEHGFTLAPAQAAWLHELRDHGWSLTGVVVRPPAVDAAPSARLRGPVLSITHEAEEPMYPGYHPPFALTDDGVEPRPPLEIAVLSEWAVAVDVARGPTPFFADTLSDRDMSRLADDAGGLPWAFRREGTLSAFMVERPTEGLGIVRFVRSDPWPTIRPSPAPRIRAYTFSLPIEVALALIVLGVWGWRQRDRRRFRSKDGRRLG